MRFLSPILIPVLLLVSGCLPRNDYDFYTTTSPREYPFPPAPLSDTWSTGQGDLTGDDLNFVCLVESHGEIWMRPYEINGRFFEPIADCTGFVQQGVASWYGSEFHGKKTSNGETFDMNALSAAHKTLPLGIHIRVTNLENGRKLILRINDRGPYLKDRVLDLSKAAAKKLGYHEKGTAAVKIEALGYLVKDWEAGQKNLGSRLPGSPAGPSFDRTRILSGSGPQAGEYHAHQVEAKYLVQIGAFQNRNSADLLMARVRYFYPAAVVETSLSGGRQVFCVRLKNFTSREEAEKIRSELSEKGFPGGLVVLEGFTKKA